MSTAEQSAPVLLAEASTPDTRTEEPIMYGYEHALAHSRMREMQEEAMASSCAHRLYRARKAARRAERAVRRAARLSASVY
ncbi:hypothetical protein [Blastococcus goldschmidtiae]|uniref:Uncharacterized protein n=1 Tax=Blastococcus goldschmidtiae TaxID=3075546 RepID=A0ABU2KBS8_9ACTN|nr:hypothetical protein [Blastococcus sp. DSM 46792]MDT0277649.1 hypothetical protein [Blastococcus sp. DSM 46792]